MKKILCITLALLMIILACASCKKDEPDVEETPDNGVPSQSAPASTPESTPESAPESTPESSGPNKEDSLVECDETVYVVNAPNGLRLRSAMDFDDDSNIKVVVPTGTELRRIATAEVGDEMWSKVVYENKEYYTSSKYLSTNKNDAVETDPVVTMEFEQREETVYITEPANLRLTPDKTDNNNIAIDLPAGTELKRTGIAFDTENDPEGLGWSRVEYEGKTYYIRNSLLATEKPAETNPET